MSRNRNDEQRSWSGESRARDCVAAAEHCRPRFHGQIRPTCSSPSRTRPRPTAPPGRVLPGRQPFSPSRSMPIGIDATGRDPGGGYRRAAPAWLVRIKIAAEFGGLGLSQINYNRIMHAGGHHCASTAVLLSAHQSIGVPASRSSCAAPEQKANTCRAWQPGRSAPSRSRAGVRFRSVAPGHPGDPTEDGALADHRREALDQQRPDRPNC